MLLSNRMNFDANANDVPVEIVEEAHAASQSVSDPETAKALFEELVPILEACRPNRTFALACGMLMEKQRNPSGMLAFWDDLLAVFPEDLTAVRMMMRWYRRERQIDVGLERAHQIFRHSHSDTSQAAKAIVAFSELKAFDEIDGLMWDILNKGLADRSLRMRYIKVLAQQSRYLEAAEIAADVTDGHKMGPGSQLLLSNVIRKAATVRKLYKTQDPSIFAMLINACPGNELENREVIGGVTFFTGQLGAGGAEKQLTRLACGFQQAFERTKELGGINFSAAPRVCVRHANPSSGGDFYLPQLKQERVRTSILAEMEPVALDQIEGLSAELANIIDILPQDIAEQTCKLIPFFKKSQTRVAYLWQDGGVLSAASAALIAGVPRIVTSFRGLPPNMRPNLMRPELEPLYQALSKRREVTFSANSQCAADAYEDWLNLAKGDIKVIPNAMLEITSEGSRSDIETWANIESRSSKCNRTVLGVFRFDENKRPDLWVRSAAEVARQDPSVRFVIVGSGYLFAETKELIQSLGMENRIFLTGLTHQVGFYLHKSDVVMHLARMEGLPNVLIEAHLTGKPVLATPAGGTSEVVEHGVTGTVLNDADHVDVEDIAPALLSLLEDKARLIEMGQQAQRMARPKYLLDSVLERTAKIFVEGAA